MVHSINDPGQDCRPAWNTGRKLGAKRPLYPKQSGLYASGWSRSTGSEIGICSILRSTVSCAAVIWSRSESVIL